MKRMIFFLLTIQISAGISSALDLPYGNFNEKVQYTGTQYFEEAQPKTAHFEGLNIQLPDTWKISNNSGTMVALSPDNTACVLMKTIDLKVLDSLHPDYLSFGEKFIQEFKTTHKLTLLKPIPVPTTFWASTDVPFDWKKLAATTNVPFDWKGCNFSVGNSDIRQLDQSGLKLISVEGAGKLGASERWASITLIGLPNGRVLLLFAVSRLEKAVVDTNKQLFVKILLSLDPQ
jgi:hypothetical protein